MMIHLDLIYQPTLKAVTRAIFSAQAFHLIDEYFNPESYFRWACGVHAPVYTDCRRLPAHPGYCAIVVQALVSSIHSNFGEVEHIIGIESSGIMWAALVGQDMSVPFGYVRKKTKAHGLQNLVEGFVKAGSKVVLIDDAIVSGNSALLAIDALQQQGIQVVGIQTIMNGNLSGTNRKFNRLGIKMRALISYSHIVEEAKNRGIISDELARELSLFYANPFDHQWNYELLLDDFLKKKFQKTA